MSFEKKAELEAKHQKYKGRVVRRSQGGGWRPLHRAARGGGCLREVKVVAVWHETCRPRLRRWLLLPSGGPGHGARQGGVENVFHTAATGTRCVVHGDDFTVVDPRKGLQWMTQLQEAWCQIKVRAVLGSGANDDEDMSLLNRWKSDSIVIEADSRRRFLVTKHFGLEESNVLTAPAIKEDEGELTKSKSGSASKFFDGRQG